MNKYYLSAFFLLVGTLLGFAIGSVLAGQKTAQKEYNNVLFATVISADENSSVEEKETSSHFLAEAVLGWTISPFFTKTLDFSISGKKQERGNIIFQFASIDEPQGKQRSDALKKALEEKIKSYNVLAKTQFGLLFEPVQTTEKQFKKVSWGALGALFGFFMVFMGLELSRIRRFFS